MRRDDTRLVLAAACLFLLSGFATLLYQVIWQRILGVFSGVHIYSITVIVTAFMAGLGFGSLLGGRIADRLSFRKAVLGFAICEVLIGLFALVSPAVYYDFAYVRLAFLTRYPLALPFVHFLLLLFPTFFMGATLPLLVRGVVHRSEAAARTIGILYGINTAGAGLGAIVAVWFLIGAVGFVGTIRIGAAMDLLAGLGAFWIAWRLPSLNPGSGVVAEGSGAEPAGPPSRRPAAVAPAVTAAEPQGRWVRWAMLYGLSGFIALSLEVLWFRYLDVAIKASPYTFGHVLGIFLVILGLGSVIGTRVVDRSPNPARVFLLGQWMITLSAAVGFLSLCWFPVGWKVTSPLLLHWLRPGTPEIAHFLDALGNPAASGAGELVQLFYMIYLFLPLWLMLVPVFFMGFTYAYVQKAVQTSIGDVGWRTGVVQASNIAGSMLGSLLTGALLLSWLGTPRSLQALIVLGTVVFGGLSIRHLKGSRLRIPAVALFAAGLVMAAAVPGRDTFWARFHGMRAGSVIAAEDATGVVVMQMNVPGLEWHPMRVNGKMHSRVPFGDEHTLLGAVPVLLHPEVRTAMIIGLGSGNTAWAAACREHTERVQVFEIVKPELGVLERLAERPGDHECVRQLLADPRIRISFTDGRLALRTSDETYDLIEADGLDPSMAYSGNLYSREFFELCRSRLNPGGILCTYVPTERTRRTVVGVFPHVLAFHAPPDFASFIIASDDPLHFDRDLLESRLDEPWTREYFERSGLGEETLGLIRRYLRKVEVTYIHGDERELYTGDVNTDLFPRDEFDKSYRGTYQ